MVGADVGVSVGVGVGDSVGDGVGGAVGDSVAGGGVWHRGRVSPGAHGRAVRDGLGVTCPVGKLVLTTGEGVEPVRVTHPASSNDMLGIRKLAAATQPTR